MFSFRRVSTFRALGDSEGDDSYNAWYNKVVGDGPGHVSSTPFNTAEKAREDLVRIVLGIAVAWLGMKVKVQAALAATSAKDKEGVLVATEDTVPTFSSSNVLLDESLSEIQYIDLLKGTESVQEGQEVNIRTRYFHNGMPIDFEDVQENNRIKWNGKSLQNVLTSFIGNERAVQDIFANKPVKLDGRRQFTFPCSADVGPYVKEGAVVLCDIVVERV